MRVASKPDQETVDPEVIRTDGGTQARAKGLDPEKVKEYAESYLAGLGLPAVVVFYDGEDYWCADGHHRVAAAILAELAEIEVEIHDGDRRAALRYALGANAAHGLARSNADKRNAVTLALADEEWAGQTDREIGRMCAVSHTMVSNMRRERAADTDDDTDEEPNVPGDEEPETESRYSVDDIDGAVRELHRLLADVERGTPQALEHMRSRIASFLGAARLRESDWEEIVEEGEAKGLWITVKPSGVLEGKIWSSPKGWSPPGRQKTDSNSRTEGEGGGTTAPSAAPTFDIDDTDPTAESSSSSEESPAASGASESGDGQSSAISAALTFFERSLGSGRMWVNSPTIRPYAEHVRRVLDQGHGGKAKLPELRHSYQLARGEKIANAHWFAILGCGLEAGLWTIEGDEHGRILLVEGGATEKQPSGSDLTPTVGAADPIAQAPEPGPAAGVEEADEGASTLSPEALAEEVAQERAARVGLPNEERAPLDAYYTPDLHASGLVRWLDERLFATSPPERVLEPSVGGGAWVRAARDAWPSARIEAIDLDPAADGLDQANAFTVGDYMEIVPVGRYDLIIGNPPYREDLMAWIDRSRRSARVVAYLLRATFAGSAERCAWFNEGAAPAHVVVVSPRPKWEGAGARAQTDLVDSYLFVWDAEHAGPTQLHFVNVRELA